MFLEKSVLETLAYSDIFNYPLTIDELHRYLVLAATKEDVEQLVEQMDGVDSIDGYYFLSGREEIVKLRQARQLTSRRAYEQAVFYGRILNALPFVRMVAVTGSLSVMNLQAEGDIDYMLVTQPGRLWTARAFAVIFGRIMRPFGYTICVNLLVSENALKWPLHDLYSAREMSQMVPLTGWGTYRKLRLANAWTASILPNDGMAPPAFANPPEEEQENPVPHFLERPLHGALGDWLEDVLRKFQRRHISRRFGSGNESNFTNDVCQGNFHDHHQLTDQHFHERLVSLGLIEDARELRTTISVA
jgi:hypothetical protein